MKITSLPKWGGVKEAEEATVDASSIAPQQSLATYEPRQYAVGAGYLKRAAWYCVNALVFHSWLFPFSGLKTALLRLFGAEVGAGLVIKPRVNIKHPWRLSIGHYVWIGEGVWIDNLAQVSIGSNVCISQGAFLLTGNHDYKDPRFRLVLREIEIEDSAWVGASAVICPGAHCRRAAVITAGAVLRSEAQASGIYSGNPATLIKQRTTRAAPG